MEPLGWSGCSGLSLFARIQTPRSCRVEKELTIGDGLAGQPSLEYFVVSPRLDVLSLVEQHEYYACDFDFDFEMCLCTSYRLTKTFVGGHNLGVFALPHSVLPMFYGLGPNWQVDWEPNRFFLVPFSSIFACYSGLMLCGSEADKAHIWQKSITKFLLFSIDSLVAVARDGVFLSKTADPHIVVDGLGVMEARPDCLARWIDELSSFPIVLKMRFDPLLPYFVLQRGKEVILVLR